MRKTIIFILLIICFAVNILEVMAEEPLFDAGAGGSTDPPTSSGGKPTCPVDISGVNWSTSWNIKSNVYADVYDEDGNYLGDLLNYKTHYFTAGRFVGIDVYEEYVITVSVTAHPYCYKSDKDCGRCNNLGLTCISYNPNSQETSSNNIMQLGHKQSKKKKCSNTTAMLECQKHSDTSYWDSKACTCYPKTCTHDCIERNCTAPTVSTQDIINKLNAIIADNSRDASYSAYMHYPNDINITKLIPVNDYRVITPTEPVVNGMTGTKTITIKIKYNPQQACLNRKTADVYYVDFEEKCDNESMTVENFTSIRDKNDKVGMYFIPLNTKSSDIYTYELKAKSMQNKELCKNYVEKYKNDPSDPSDPKYQRWRKLLLGSEKESMANMNYAQAKDAVANGCYYAMHFEFRVKQEFYNENASNKLEGYGFYYRPIDVNNPFPNGLGNSTYWGKGEIYNTDNNIVTIDGKTYRLSDSYANITYIADVANPNAIRGYNEQENQEGRSYMSWEKMNKDGTSKFIEHGYVTRYNGYSFYKLGCGPSNSTWEECK